MGFNPKKSLENIIYKYHGYTARGYTQLSLDKKIGWVSQVPNMESYEVATRCWNCSRAWVGRSRRGVSPTAVCLSENTTMLDGILHLFPDYTLVGGNSNIVWCSSLFGEWSHLTNMFQMGWNQQLDTNKIVPCFFFGPGTCTVHIQKDLDYVLYQLYKYQDLVGRHGSLIRGSPNKVNDTSPFFFGARDESYVLFLGGIPHPLTVKYSSVHFYEGSPMNLHGLHC